MTAFAVTEDAPLSLDRTRPLGVRGGPRGSGNRSHSENAVTPASRDPSSERVSERVAGSLGFRPWAVLSVKVPVVAEEGGTRFHALSVRGQPRFVP